MGHNRWSGSIVRSPSTMERTMTKAKLRSTWRCSSWVTTPVQDRTKLPLDAMFCHVPVRTDILRYLQPVLRCIRRYYVGKKQTNLLGQDALHALRYAQLQIVIHNNLMDLQAHIRNVPCMGCDDRLFMRLNKWNMAGSDTWSTQNLAKSKMATLAMAVIPNR